MTLTRHAIGSGRAQFILPGDRFLNATEPLEHRSILDMTITDKLIITADEAASLLVDDAEYVHNYANPAGGLMIGVDYDRADAIEAFRKAEQIEIGGSGCKAMRHPIVVWDKLPGRFTFFEADMAKVEAFEAARAALSPS